MNEWSGGKYLCPCYSRRTHYPILEKSSAQNIVACKNQGKQRNLSDPWKSNNVFFLKQKTKKKQGMTQKRQKDWLEYKF